MSDLTIAERIADDKAGREFAQNLISKFKLQNQDNEIGLTQAFWVHHRLRALEITVGGVNYVLDIMNMVISGDVEIAYYALAYAAPDDMTQTHHWLSAEKINLIRADMAAFLGL